MEDLWWFVALIGCWLFYFVNLGIAIRTEIWSITILPIIVLSFMALVTLNVLSKWRRLARELRTNTR